MAGNREPGPQGPAGQQIDDGTLCLGLSPAPGPVGCRDLDSSAEPSDKAVGRSLLTADHIEKVRLVINIAIEEAARRARDNRGNLSKTRFKILLDALHIVFSYRDGHAPWAINSLVYRDADHYLSARTIEFTLHYKRDKNGSPILQADGYPEVLEDEPNPAKAVAQPAVTTLYEAAKTVSFLVQDVTGWRNMMSANAAHEPARPGGSEWAALGFEHYKHWDSGRETRVEPPAQIGPLSKLDLERFLPHQGGR